MTSITTDPPPAPSWLLIRDELVGFVTKRVENRDLAEDIVQDVFERLQRAENGSIANPQAWLYRAARNATIDHYRTRRLTRPLDNLDQLRGADDEGDAATPNAATRELATCLRPLIQHLPDKYRRALQRVDIDGQTQQQAAAAEGISLSGMKSRVQRGRARLGELLTDCCALTTDRHGAISDYRRRAGGSCAVD